jgi:hypothetical protein
MKNKIESLINKVHEDFNILLTDTFLDELSNPTPVLRIISNASKEWSKLRFDWWKIGKELQVKYPGKIPHTINLEVSAAIWYLIYNDKLGYDMNESEENSELSKLGMYNSLLELYEILTASGCELDSMDRAEKILEANRPEMFHMKFSEKTLKRAQNNCLLNNALNYGFKNGLSEIETLELVMHQLLDIADEVYQERLQKTLNSTSTMFNPERK